MELPRISVSCMSVTGQSQEGRSRRRRCGTETYDTMIIKSKADNRLLAGV